jgi:hypothetical protein
MDTIHSRDHEISILIQCHDVKELGIGECDSLNTSISSGKLIHLSQIVQIGDLVRLIHEEKDSAHTLDAEILPRCRGEGETLAINAILMNTIGKLNIGPCIDCLLHKLNEGATSASTTILVSNIDLSMGAHHGLAIVHIESQYCCLVIAREDEIFRKVIALNSRSPLE